MKLDLPPAVPAGCGAAPPRAASEAAMRAPNLGGPEPGSSGWSGGRSGAIGSELAMRRRGGGAGVAERGGGSGA